MIVRRTGIAFMAMLWACGPCLAQLDTASIVGTVFDSSGAVVPNAKVVVQNMGTSAAVELTSNESGYFIAPVLRVGKYKVTASLAGFKTFIQEGITLSVNDRISLSIVLQPGAITEEVTVMGQGSVVETASTTLGAVVNSQQVEDLPLNGRAVDLLVTLAPGVVNLGPTTLRSMNGATQGRLWENGAKFLVDGGDSSQIDSDLADSGYGSAARINRISVDAVAEFRLANSSYTAEYGASVGGVVNFISKSGTNNFHGNLFEFFRNEKLDARNYFNKPPAIKPAFRLNQYGGTLHGPIVRDKLFFFAAYEGVRQRRGETFTTFTPTAAYRATLAPGLLDIMNHLPLPTGAVSVANPDIAEYVGSRVSQLREDTWMAKVDYQPTGADRFTFRHNYNWSFTKDWFNVGTDEFRPITSLPQTSKISYTRTLTPNLLNEAGFFLNRLHANTPAAGSEEVRTTPITIILGTPIQIGPGIWDMDVANTLFTFMDTLSWVKGRHQMKFGAQISRMGANKAVYFQQYAYFFGLGSDPLGYASNIPYALGTLGWPRPGMRITQQNYFVQDDIAVSKSLTINAGLRYQYDSPPTEKYGRISNFNFATGDLDPVGTKVFDSPKTNFGPRFGLAYSPFQSKKTVFRAGFGVYIANFNAADAQFLPTNVPGYSTQYSVSIYQNPFLTFIPFPDISSYVGTASPTAFNKDWQAAYTEQWSFNVQQGFGESTVLQIGYVGNRGLHYSPIQQANPIIPGTGLRRYPNFGSMSYYGAGASTNYNSLQATFRRRMSHGLDFNINYTWAHSLDQGGMSFGPGAQNPDDYESEWASSDYDVRHNLAFSYTYRLPKLGGPAWLGEGWQMNGITVMRSGFPINVVCACDPVGIGDATGRTNLVPGESFQPSPFDMPGNETAKMININAFSSPLGTGQFGNAGRNLFSGPAAFNWDFSMFKQFRVTETQKLEFRAEVFNVFNTPQFNNPAASLADLTTFGRTFSTLTSAGGFGSHRQIQFGLKYSF